MMLHRRLSGGELPITQEPQTHLLSNFPKFIIAWNNLSLSNCCLQINDKKKKKVIKEIDKIKKKNLPISLYRPEKDRVPMTCSGAS
jgi:hypothetical protein